MENSPDRPATFAGMIAQANDLRSLGKLTADFQAPYPRIAGIVSRLGLRPAVTLNGVPYFDEEAIDRIGNELRQPATAGHSRRDETR